MIATPLPWLVYYVLTFITTSLLLYFFPQNLLCYHNFVTNERIYDYKMTNKDFDRINIDNYVGYKLFEARERAVGTSDSNHLRGDSWVHIQDLQYAQIISLKHVFQ